MNIKALGYTDGAEAYRAEEPRQAPTMSHLSRYDQAERIAYMKAWYDGWDMENIRDDSRWKKGLKS
jgi:hypothetical protein